MAPTACRHMVSGTISLSSSECFSPFPHGTGSLSVSQEYLALPDGPGRFTQDYTCPALLRMTQGRLQFADTELSSTTVCRSRQFSLMQQSNKSAPTTPEMHNVQNRFGLFPGRSPLLGESLLFSLPAGTKMFQFPAFACPQKITDMHRLHPCGLPHSEIRASTAMCTYARLIAAYHVLHRLCEPRHPPCALTYFCRSYFQL